MDKIYDPRKKEKEIYQLWEKSGFFNPDKLPQCSKSKTERYVVYMPLPNVTGELHMGHVLNNVIQDIVIRFERMRGKRTLFLPGTDHAGIATQYVVEKKLKKEGENRFEMGRKKFIEEIWKWKEKYGNIILSQLKKLGVSADWTRTRFTMDENYKKDVLKTFVHYYKKGLIYRGLRTVNWCPRCGTSLSGLELEYKDEKTKLWQISYPLAGSRAQSTEQKAQTKHKTQNEKQKFITVATTRPETMLGDTAIAVNPSDKRYSELIGKTVILPIVGREIPIIADKAIDLKFGTGAVKVTPAHDISDFEIGERHKLLNIKIINERGEMTESAGTFQGLKTPKAREEIIEILKKEGRVEKEENYNHRIAVCYRCNSIIEPIPSVQWFLKMQDLAKIAIQAVKTKKVKLVPKKFEKVYFDRLLNIRNWTISRQIWWGHRLPVYFCKNKLEEFSISSDKIRNPRQSRDNFQFSKKLQNEKDNFTVSLKKPKKCPFCKSCSMKQADDVLDTWFSSAIWPFGGLSKKDKEKYYPGNTLITGRDIIHLWVARMIFSGQKFMKRLPFKKVFLHGTILNKEGKRMSKSLGTGIDPLHYVDNFGADAVRFGIIWQGQGQDIRWDETAVVAGKKFVNKIWNAGRFVLYQIDSDFQNKTRILKNIKIINQETQTEADKKIIRKLKSTKRKAEKCIEDFEFSKALKIIYDFFWHSFCDVYIEKSKKQLLTDKRRATQKNLLFVLTETLKIIHPFLPFVTEKMYQELPVKKEKCLMVEKW